ncbi:unnamed protein product [Mytilus coruscus]|uniref:CUB domain-containing protein n=1 Tax=Mytilus coruscus TaxID=42192 RepID=A0A6J7ZUV9_MYTCO|nr:unnamed protein product [Mytilus coruscus]
MKSYIYVVIGILLVLKDASCTIHLTATPYLQRFVSHDAYDGLNSSAALLLQTCCGSANPPPFTVQSTDGTMYVLFSTDETIAKEGFRVSYILQGAPTSTVSTTVQVAASKKEDKTLLYLIIACAVTALLILIMIILICVICCKKKSKAKKTKQKVHKKFGRSAPRPVVVTSESGFEAELEGNSESPSEDLKIQKKTISYTISPISNKQNKEIAKTDKKEDKIKMETITHNYQGEIQSTLQERPLVQEKKT